MTANAYLGSGAMFCCPCGEGRIDGLHRDYEPVDGSDLALVPVRLGNGAVSSCTDCGRMVPSHADAS